RATIIDLRGRSKIIEAPCVLSIVEREGRLSTGSPIADSLLLGGLPRRSVALLTSPACDEKDSLVQGFCAIAPGATVYVSTDVERSAELHKIYHELKLVVCRTEADLLPTKDFIQFSRSIIFIYVIDYCIDLSL